MTARGTETACNHCGLPLRAASTKEAAYCCTGCYLASHLGARTAGEPDRLLARILLSALLAMGVMVFSLSLYAEELNPTGGEDDATKSAIQGLFRLGALAPSAPVLFVLGGPLLDSVVRLKRWFSSDALVLFATTAAWAVSTWNTLFAAPPDVGAPKVYFDSATMVLVLFHVGRWLDARARERARARLGETLAAHPETFARLDAESEQEVPLSEARVGDTFRLRPGSAVPLDAEVVSGQADLDTASLTGEQLPRTVRQGAAIHAGTRILDGSLVARATSVEGECVRDRIEHLFERALEERAPIAQLSDRLAGALLPIVCLVALCTLGLQWSSRGPETALLNAGCVVLIACPCALGIATPLAFWIAVGTAWQRGILVRGGEALERLARIRRIFLDKTGTLTDPVPELVRTELSTDKVHGFDRDTAFRIAAALEEGSEHPLARAVRRAWRETHGAPLPPVEDFRTLPGVGVEARVEGELWRLVRGAATAGESVAVLERGHEGTAILELGFRTRLRPDARQVTEALKFRGLRPEVLTGDGPGPAAELSALLDVPVEGELLPDDKARRVAAARGPSAFVGDGLNDAVALATADVGIALPGGIGELSEAAEIHLFGPDLTRLPELHNLARRTVRIARANLLWAFAYNGIGIALAANGNLTPIFAASGMVLSSALVVLNSGRLADRPPTVNPHSAPTQGEQALPLARASA